MSSSANESATTPSNVEPDFDHRDRQVLAALREQNPDPVSLTQLRNLYRKKTDVRRSDTLAKRTRFLTSEGPFERVAFQKWRFGEDS